MRASFFLSFFKLKMLLKGVQLEFFFNVGILKNISFSTFFSFDNKYNPHDHIDLQGV